MAARSKKKDSLAKMSQDNQAIEDPVLAAEPSQETFAGNSEVNMSTNNELPEDELSGAAINEAVEPVINLEANLSIQNVVKLYDKVKKAYAAYDAIEIDASHVASVDTATLQLFVALKKDAAKQQKQVDFFQPSERFIESARLLDLLDILEITYV
jgi:anti-anti-sigma regulatory factor